MYCAKHRTTCKIITKDGQEFNGENYCLVPQEVCPRDTGEGYEKCKTICFQIGHGEEVALMKALESGADVKDAKAIVGHERICDNCKSLLMKNGITDIECTGLKKKIIYIATPYRAKTKDQFEKQLNYTKDLAAKQVAEDNDVIVPHLYYPQFLNDDIPEERVAGMESAKRLIKVCGKVLVGAKHGISQGVQAEIDYAKENNILVEFVDKQGVKDA